MNAGAPGLLNPFPGLRPFRTDEDHLFFGREKQTGELLTLLRERRFIAVVGTSGSGKSSLVRAGLLPELEGGTMNQAGSKWEVAVLRPGGDPIANLAQALAETSLYEATEPDAVPQLVATLRHSRMGLLEAIRQSDLEAGANLLVVVDQFEEVFRFRQAGSAHEEAAEAFVGLLLEASAQRDVRIYVVLTMRSDYLGECAQFRGLAEAVNGGEYLIPQLNRDQLRSVIEGPVRVGGGRISFRLLQQLLNDVARDQNQLPVLQHALMRTWDYWVAHRREDEPLDLAHYQAIGGMGEALSRHADEIYQQFAGTGLRNVAERIFKALTERGPDNRGIRRPTRFGRLCEIVNAEPGDVRAVIEAFRQTGRTFLMPPEPAGLGPDTVIDISHESLMWLWQRLRVWVEDEAQSARIYRRLADTAALHLEGKADLYHQPDLQIAVNWRERQRPNAPWAERYHSGFSVALNFLEKSQQASRTEDEAREAARRHELDQVRALAEAERLRAEEQIRFAARLKWFVRGLGLVTMIAVTFLLIGIAARRQAVANARLAAENAERATQREAAARRILYGADMNLVQEALEVNNRGKARRLLDRHLPEHGQADLRGWEWRYLRGKTQGDQTVSLGPFPQHVFTVDVSPDGRFLALGEFYGRIRLWDLSNRTEVAVLQDEGSIRGVAQFSPDGTVLAAAGEGGRLRLWDFPSRHERTSLTISGQTNSSGGFIRTLAFSEDGGRIAAIGGWQGFGFQAVVWDLKTGQVLRRIPSGPLTAHHGTVCFSSDSQRLFVGSRDGRIRAVDIATGESKLDFPAHGQGITALAIAPGGKRLASGAGYSDGSVRLWNADSGEEIHRFSGHASWICWLEFAPDGSTLFSSSADQTVKVWDLNAKAERTTLIGHLDEVYALSVFEGGKRVATGCKDGAVNLWEADNRERFKFYASRPLPGGAGNLEFMPDGKHLVTLGAEGRVILFSAADLSESGQLEELGAGNAMLHSPDGKHLFLVSQQEARIYDAQTRTVLHTLDKKFPITFLDSGRILLVGDSSGVLFLDSGTFEERGRAELPDRSLQVAGFSISPDGRRIALGTARGEFQIAEISLESGIRIVGRAEAHRRAVTSLDWSPDGSRLISGSEDGSAYLWNTETWKPAFHLRGHLKAVHSVRFSRDGKRAATGGGDRDAVILWDPATGQELVTLGAKGDIVRGIRFAPDGNTIAAITSLPNTVLHLWRAQSFQEKD